VPRISTFYGIGIWMYWYEAEHSERPHFHARYGSAKASVSVDGELLAGRLPPRALALAGEWAALHRDELLANWARARNLEPLASIAPLD
jgi:hypothetical protein